LLSKVQNPFMDIQKEMAKFYIADNRLEEALDIYLNLLRTNPDDSEILAAMRALYFSVGNGQERKNLGGKFQDAGMEEDISNQTGDERRNGSYYEIEARGFRCRLTLEQLKQLVRFVISEGRSIRFINPELPQLNTKHLRPFAQALLKEVLNIPENI